MNSDNLQEQETVSFTKIIGVLKRSIFIIILSVMLCVAIGLLTSSYLPQKYKSKAILSVQSSYFQHPLVNNLISEVQDPSEMSARRLAILRLALSDQFLDTLGHKYNLIVAPTSEADLLMQREALLKKIEYFSVSPSNFQISIVTNDPTSSFLATQEVLAQMSFTLIEKRYQSLMQAREAILNQAKLLNSTLSDTASGPQRAGLVAQLAAMESNLSALRSRFTDSHPDVMKARGQTRSLESRINNLKEKPSSSDEYTKVFLSPSSRATTQDIFDDLLKKLSHLNIVLGMEKDRENVSYLGIIEQPRVPSKAFFPNPVEFALFGALAGLMLSAMLITYRELNRVEEISSDQAAELLGLELLGEIPSLNLHQLLPLLNAPTKTALALPHRRQEG